MDFERVALATRLARWLGPWTSDSRRPVGRRRMVTVEGAEGPFDAFLYEPRGKPKGALFLQAGLHYLGPMDHRLDRFLAILADIGFVAFAPMLPDFRRLWMDRRQIDDCHAALRTFVSLPEYPTAFKPGMFSISFGSYPTLHVAAREGEEIGGVVVFGGFGDFADTVRFALRGDESRPHDPLNKPAIFLNLFDYLDLPESPRSREALRRGWLSFVRSTWGRPYMREPSYHQPVVRRISERLPEDARDLFEKVLGVRPGGPELLEPALARATDRLPHFDMAEACAAIRVPVTLTHGRDDDVIPYEESLRLADMMGPDADAQVHLTGMYGHTGQNGVDLGALRQELHSMWSIVLAIVDAGRQRIGPLSPTVGSSPDL